MISIRDTVFDLISTAPSAIPSPAAVAASAHTRFRSASHPLTPSPAPSRRHPEATRFATALC